MTATAETIPQAVGDRTLRGLDVDQIFAQPQLSDDAPAACLTTTGAAKLHHGEFAKW